MEELAASVPHFEQLSANKRQQLCDIVVNLDLIGMTTLSRLQFSTETLAFYAPPREIAKNKCKARARRDYGGRFY
jgi:hypothetical protein